MDTNRPNFDPPAPRPESGASPAGGDDARSTPSPAPSAPRTTAVRPRSKLPLVIGIVAVVVLALVAGLIWWQFLRPQSQGANVPVNDLDAEPEIGWTFQLPDGAQDVQWSPVGDDQALVYSSMVNLEATTRLTLIDLNTGEPAWEVDLDEAAQNRGAAWLAAMDLEGTEFVSAYLYADSETVPSSLVLINRESGELHSETELPIGTSIYSAAPSGNLYLADWANSELSRVAGIDDLTNKLWTTPVPSFEGGDFAIGVDERDGHVMYGRPANRGGIPGYDWPLYFVAANIEDGSVPPWAPGDSESTSFTFVGDQVIQMEVAETTTATALDAEGVEQWHLDNFSGMVVPIGDMLFAIDHREDHTAVTRYDPTSGSPVWDGPASLPLGSAVTAVGDQVVALATTENPEAVTIDVRSGALGHRLSFPQSFHTQFFVGSDRLYVASRTDLDSDLTLIAQPVDQPGSLWTKTFAPAYNAAQVGSHLILVDQEQFTIAGLVD